MRFNDVKLWFSDAVALIAPSPATIVHAGRLSQQNRRTRSADARRTGPYHDPAVGVFERGTSVQQVEAGLWSASIDPTWAIGEAVHGGVAQCVMVRAAVGESSHQHPVATSAHFLAPTIPGVAQVTVQRLREGRTASTLRTALIQDGVEKVVAHVTVATLGLQPPAYEEAPQVVVPPAECIPRPRHLPDGSEVRFLEPIEVRLDPRQVGGPHDGLSGVPEVRGWIRARDSSPPDAAFLLFCVDALPPTVLEIGGQGWSPTVQLSTYVRARPAPGWLSVVARAHAVVDGWFDEEAEVWDSSGRLVAQARQLGRCRLNEPGAGLPGT
jgi:acyl-CoA thioesterase